MGDCRSLRDCLLESVDDLDLITKQILESMLNRDKHRRGNESLNCLVTLFERRINEVKGLFERVPEFRAREDLIRELENCVQERNEVIDKLETNLKVAEMALTSAVYQVIEHVMKEPTYRMRSARGKRRPKWVESEEREQANNKIHSVRESEAHPVNSEVVIRLAHQISKNYSVSAPLYWQQGDPSRPFPTEPEFRASALAAPRTNPPVVPPAFSLLRQQHAATGGMGRVSSPMTGMSQMPVQGKVWSPRTGYQQASPSPRGRGGSTQWTGRGGTPGGVSPFQKRASHMGENSPRMVSPTVNINFVSPPPRMNPPPVSKVEQMSSDSSSSSSSDDESPK